MGIHDLGLFLLAGVLLNITPGPDMALIVARSTQQGTRAGIIAALGVGVGGLHSHRRCSYRDLSTYSRICSGFHGAESGLVRPI